MRCIDADALIDDLKHDVAVDQDSLDYEELTDLNRENIQFDKDCKQNAIDLLQHAPTIEPHCETCEAFNKTRLLIPQPERQKGEWIDYTEDGYVECPFCHSATNCDGNKDELHFCFSCGADMRGEQDG